MIDRAGPQDRFGAAEQILDLQQIAVRNTACNGVTRALVRSTKTPSKRASSASLSGSISKARPGLPLALGVRRR